MAEEPLEVSPELVLPAGELRWRFTPSGGPGGQHANRSSTRVELHFDIQSSPSLSESQRDRLRRRLGPDVRVVVGEERSQRRNRERARERLAAMLREALVPPRSRRSTRPPAAAGRRRLEAKRRRSDLKRTRRPPGPEGV